MKDIQKFLCGILLCCLVLSLALTMLPMDAAAETVTQTSEKIYGYADWGGARAATFELEVEASVNITFAYSEGLSSLTLVKIGSGTVTPTSVSSGHGNYGDTYKYDKRYYYQLEPGEYAINVFAGAYENTGGTVYWIQVRATYEVHTHNYNYSTKKVGPTCTARGYTKHTCSCGDYYTDNYVDKLPHTEVYAQREAPTCTKTGKDEGTKCSVCGTTISGRTEIPKLPHDTAVEIPRVEPTCTTLGKTVGAKCSVCGTISIAQKDIPKLPHDTAVEIPRLEPTCTTLGKTVGAKCSVCGTISIAQEEIPKLPHTEVSAPDVAATCTTDGKTDVKFCTVCEQEVSRAVIPKLGHNFVNYFCTRCGCVDSSSVRDYGQCGDNAKWVLTKSGTMIISGTGAMWDYDYKRYNQMPWYSYKTSIKSLVVEDGITSIGDRAFSSCNNLTSVSIPKTVTSIGEFGFTGSGMKSIVIPEGVTTIKPYAFQECASLASVTLPSTVTSLGAYAFYYCSQLRSIAIPDGITVIDTFTFGYTSLQTITIPSSVTSIGNGVFSSTKLSAITIPSSVTNIGYTVFQNCTNLKRITFEGAAPVISGTNFLNKVKATAYYHSTDPSWTASVRQNYGGTITWKAIESCNHTAVTDPAAEPTCIGSGKTEGSHCSVCGVTLVKQEIIPATGHSCTYAVEKEPTLTEAGTLKCTCTVCGHEAAATLPKLNEEDYSYTIVQQPTYTETGIGRWIWKNDGYGEIVIDVTLDKLVLLGDVNSDGRVNTQDRLVLTRYLAKWTGYEEDTINLIAADVNHDGKVNAQDRLILTRYLAKWTGYEELS